MVTGKKFSDEEVAAAVKAYVDMVPIPQILDDFSMGISTLREKVRAAKIPPRKRLMNPNRPPSKAQKKREEIEARAAETQKAGDDRVAKVAKFKALGWSDARVGIKLNIAPSTVRRDMEKAKKAKGE